MFNNDSMKENLDSIDQVQPARRGTDYHSASLQNTRGAAATLVRFSMAVRNINIFLQDPLQDLSLQS